MGVDEDGYPTIGNGGRTVAVPSDDSGDVSYDSPQSADEMMRIAGIKEEMTTNPLGQLGGEVSDEDLMTFEEEIRERLPEYAELQDDGRLKVRPVEGSYTERNAFLNDKRRAIIKLCDEGNDPMEIVQKVDTNRAYVYQMRDAFSFLLEDPVLKGAFIDDGGEFAPGYNPKAEDEGEEEEITPEEYAEKKQDAHAEEGEEEERIPVEEAREMAEKAYDNGREEAMGAAEASANTDRGLFDGDEWWDIMKTLMENGQDEYARRIASEIEFE